MFLLDLRASFNLRVEGEEWTASNAVFLLFHTVKGTRFKVVFLDCK